MAKILVLSGSARPNSAGKIVVQKVKETIEKYSGNEVVVVNPADLNLPFFNAELSPSTEGFLAADENVKAWTEKVGEADGVVLVAPEYNGSLSAVQKNAIDWVYNEWNEKPVSFVGYGWNGGARALDNALVVFNTVKAIVLPRHTTLNFAKQVNPDGSIIDESTIDEQLEKTISELLDSIK